MGLGDEIACAIEFEASARHAVQLVPRLKELLAGESLGPADVDELYVSAGPGSFTGLRVGLTVARTMGQMVSSLMCVAVPTVRAVAMQASELEWENLAVVLDARDDMIYVNNFVRRDGEIVPDGEPRLVEVGGFLSDIASPITLTGEGLAYHDCTGPGITIAPQELHFPTARGIWSVGRRMALDGQFTDYNMLTPIYARRPEVLRPEE